MIEFYELQLILLTLFCIFSLLLERLFSNRKQQLTKETPEDRLENGKHWHGATNSLAALTRQYLVVYAIVMGE
jgi:hypothetical protein